MLILEGHTQPVLAVAYAPDSQILASGGVDRSVRFWDLGGGCLQRYIPDAGGTVLSLAFSPDGGTLAVGTHSQVTLWDLQTGQPSVTLRGQRGGTYIVAFVPHSRRVILAGYLDPHLSLYDLDDVTVCQPLSGHRNGALALAPCPAAPWLVSGGGLPNRGDLFLWDTSTGERLREFTEPLRVGVAPSGYRRMTTKIMQIAHIHSVQAVALSPGGQQVASGGKDRLVKLWSSATGQLLTTLSGHSAKVVALSFPPDGGRLLSADEEGVICLWDLLTLKPGHRWDWKVGQLRSVVFSPNGLTAAAGGHRDVIVWDIDELDR